jgi:hypothetical protein
MSWSMIVEQKGYNMIVMGSILKLTFFKCSFIISKMISDEEVQCVISGTPYVNLTGNLYIIYYQNFVTSLDNPSDLQDFVNKLRERSVFISFRVKDYEGYFYNVSYDEENTKITLDHGKYPDPDFCKIKEKEDELRRKFIDVNTFTSSVSNLVCLDEKEIHTIRNSFNSAKSKYEDNDTLFCTPASKIECDVEELEDLSFLIPESLAQNITIAGGYVVNTVLGLKHKEETDIDIFIVSDNPLEILEKYLKWIDSNFTIKWCRRNDKVITIKIKGQRLLQIILRDYKSVEQVIVGFDIDSCSCCFYNGNFYATERCHYALVNRVNHVDIDRVSSSYECRLAKYACDKGFYVKNPGFNRTLSKASIEHILRRRPKRPIFYKGLSKLLKIEGLLVEDGKEENKELLGDSDYDTKLTDGLVKTKTKTLQNGKFVCFSNNKDCIHITSDDINIIMNTSFYGKNYKNLHESDYRVKFITHSPNSQGYYDKFSASWVPILISWKCWNNLDDRWDVDPIDFM